MAAALLGAFVAALVVRVASEPVSMLDAGRTPAAVLPPDVIGPARTPRGATALASADRGGRPTPAPRALRIDRLDLRMRVIPQGVDRAGAMALPDTPYALGWYRFGSRPADAEGATVLAGHVDTAEAGPGPLARIGALSPGDRIGVLGGRRTTTYAVTSVTRIDKDALNLPAIFSRGGRPRLHLVTCGGAYLPDRGGYQDNVVVAAKRVKS